MNPDKKKQLARYYATQERVLEALALAYEQTDELYKILKEITDEMWEDLRPAIQELIEKYLDDPHAQIDLDKYPAIRMAIREIEMRHHQQLLEYYWIGYNVITESLVSTYQKASLDAYQIMSVVPTWQNQEINPVIRQQAEVRITDTYITSNKLPIPWCSDGKVYSQRLYGHIANFQSKLNYVLSEGVAKGRGMEWMTQAWRKLVGATAYDAARLLKTETMAFYNEGLKDSYIEMGVEYVEIVGDAECGGICLDYVDGDPIRIVDAEINVELPPYHPNCACSFVAWEETEIVENPENTSGSQDEE